MKLSKKIASPESMFTILQDRIRTKKGKARLQEVKAKQIKFQNCNMKNV